MWLPTVDGSAHSVQGHREVALVTLPDPERLPDPLRHGLGPLPPRVAVSAVHGLDQVRGPECRLHRVRLGLEEGVGALGDGAGSQAHGVP